MPITIKGIRIMNLYVGRDDDGKEKITANYQLISSADKVLAKESLSTGKGYGENTFQPSPQTMKALTDAVSLYRKDVELSLGLESAE
jgi:hypothetical protein